MPQSIVLRMFPYNNIAKCILFVVMQFHLQNASQIYGTFYWEKTPICFKVCLVHMSKILYAWALSPEADVCCIYGIRPASIYNAEGHFRSEALVGIIYEVCADKMGFASQLDHKYYAILRHRHNKWHSRKCVHSYTHTVKEQLKIELYTIRACIVTLPRQFMSVIKTYSRW